jgi:hypothetical protein
MSARYYNTEHVHPYSWDQVAEGLFQRYPNPFASHVLSEDTVMREILPGGLLYSRRFLTKTNKVPKWGERWMAGFVRRVPLVEESFVDRQRKTITTYTRNVGLSQFMTATEKVTYKVNPDEPDTTIAVKEAWVESGFYGLRSAIKSFGIERFKNNCEKATDGFNFVLEKLQQQRNCLREIGHVKMVEFQERKDQLKNQAELLKIAARERSDIIKEKTDNLKETARERTDIFKETAREKSDAWRETARKAADYAKTQTSLHASGESSRD